MTVFTSNEWLNLTVEKKQEIIIGYHIGSVAYRISIDKGVSKEEALESFEKTKTYNLLLNPDSELYLEDTEYVYDMYLNELAGDWKEWLKI